MRRYRFRIEPDQRRRKNQYLAVAVFAVSLLIAGLVVAFSGDDDKPVNASDTKTTTTTSPSDDVIASSTTTGLGATTTTSTTAKRPSATTTSTSVLTNTTVPIETADLDCVRTTPADPTPIDPNWSEYWTTRPTSTNKAMQLQVCVDDTTPKVGQLITISVIAYDPDQQVGTGPCDIRVTWEGSPKSCRTSTVVGEPTQTPDPDTTSKKTTMTYTHTYKDSGEQNVDVAAWSGADDQKRSPYKSYASISRQITVHK